MVLRTVSRNCLHMNLAWDNADRVLIAGGEHYLESIARDAADHIRSFVVALKLLLLLVCFAAIGLALLWLILALAHWMWVSLLWGVGALVHCLWRRY